MSVGKDFSLEEKNQLRNYEVYSVELKTKNADIFEKIEVHRASLIQICVAYDKENRIHCGIIVENSFQIKNSNFPFAVIHLLRNGKRVKINVHLRSCLEDCQKCLASVYGRENLPDQFLLSEPAGNKSPFKTLETWIERTLDRQFVLSIDETNGAEYFNGTNCLKFVESFSRAFNYEISTDFSEKLKTLLFPISKINIKEKESVLLDIALGSTTRIPPIHSKAYQIFCALKEGRNSNMESIEQRLNQNESNELNIKSDNDWCSIL